MKFKPLLGSDLSGHVGGIVASHNTYGPYFRQRVKPVNKNTEQQQAQRAAIAYVSQTWRALDPYVQASWMAAHVTKTSKSGDKIILTGAAAFQFVNTLRHRCALSIITDPPTDPDPVGLWLPSVAFTAFNTVQVTFAADDEWNAADGAVILSAGLLTSTGQTYKTAALAAARVTFPGVNPASVVLPFAVPINARVRLQFHATAPDGRQSTYVTVDTENTTFPPPSPAALRVVEVTLVGTKKYLWRFDGPITVTPGADSYLVADGDTSGTVVQAGPHNALVTYSTAAGAAVPWSIATQPTTIAETILLPQTGTTN